MIGDIAERERGGQGVVDAINGLPPGNGRACYKICNVTKWDDQVDLFEFAITRFGGADIVVSVTRLRPRQFTTRCSYTE